jgi:hypothetical protein
MVRSRSSSAATTNTDAGNGLSWSRFGANARGERLTLAREIFYERKGRRPMAEITPEYNAKIIAEFRASRGRVGGTWEETPLLLLHHPGAKVDNQPRRHGTDPCGRTKASLDPRVAAHLLFARSAHASHRGWIGQAEARGAGR